MAYKNLEDTIESCIYFDYAEIHQKLDEKGMSISQLKADLSLSDNIVQQIINKERLSVHDEKEIRKYLRIDSSFSKTNYYFVCPHTPEGHSDKWRAIGLYEKMKARKFKILVDRIPHKEDKYKLIGNVNGEYYEKEDNFAYDTTAIIVFASYIEECLD